LELIVRPRGQVKSGELQQHITATYLTLRIGVAVIALTLPILLWGGGILQGIPLQDSMSAYYHAATNGGSMRNWFVGILFAVGVFLYLYKGFSFKENYALNLAGAFAIGIAIFPMEWNCGEECVKISMHGICAVSFFLCIAYVCIRCASETLHLLEDSILEKRYRTLYTWLGIGMIVSPLTALLLTLVFRRFSSYTFFVEAAGVWVFSTYWLVKSRELSLTSAERLAIQEKIELAPVAKDQ
jgi:hypothetical protein